MRANRKTGSTPEVRLRTALHRRGLRFRKNHLVVLNGVRVTPDVVFTRARLAVFVDGCFWHRCPQHGTAPRANAAYWIRKLTRNAQRDRSVDEALWASGWATVRMWEHEIVHIQAAADRVRDALISRG